MSASKVRKLHIPPHATPFHDPRLATTLETTGRSAFLRRQRRLQLALNVLSVVAALLFIASVVLFCWMRSI